MTADDGITRCLPSFLYLLSRVLLTLDHRNKENYIYIYICVHVQRYDTLGWWGAAVVLSFGR